MAVDALELRPRNAVALFDAAVRLCATTTGVWALTLPTGALLVATLFTLVEASTPPRVAAGAGRAVDRRVDRARAQPGRGLPLRRAAGARHHAAVRARQRAAPPSSAHPAW